MEKLICLLIAIQGLRKRKSVNANAYRSKRKKSSERICLRIGSAEMEGVNLIGTTVRVIDEVAAGTLEEEKTKRLIKKRYRKRSGKHRQNYPAVPVVARVLRPGFVARKGKKWRKHWATRRRIISSR